MISIEDLAQLADVSPRYLEVVAQGVVERRLFATHVYRTKRGDRRQVVDPSSPLQIVTKNLHRGLSAELSYQAPDHVHGFIRGRSIKTNAAQHLAKPCVLRVDLERFFPSIDSGRIDLALRHYGLDGEAAEIAIRIMTIDGSLPIGLSTSPLLSNLAFEQTDTQLKQYCANSNLSITRYVDDLTFSGDISDSHYREIERILVTDGWAVNKDKVAFMRRGGPQYVTGLYVGCSDYPRIPRPIKRQLRWVKHMIETVGYESFMSDFGGAELGLLPRRLKGWSRHIASIEPNIGYPLWRFFDENIPEGYAEPVVLPHMIGGLRVIHTLEDIEP